MKGQMQCNASRYANVARPSDSRGPTINHHLQIQYSTHLVAEAESTVGYP